MSDGKSGQQAQSHHDHLSNVNPFQRNKVEEQSQTAHQEEQKEGVTLHDKMEPLLDQYEKSSREAESSQKILERTRNKDEHQEASKAHTM
ncbi:MAG: hypothetical protein Q9162_003119 [Coniocarpon cinnabarinum]